MHRVYEQGDHSEYMKYVKIIYSNITGCHENIVTYSEDSVGVDMQSETMFSSRETSSKDKDDHSMREEPVRASLTFNFPREKHRINLLDPALWPKNLDLNRIISVSKESLQTKPILFKETTNRRINAKH